MSRRAQENVLVLLLIGLFLAVIVASLGYGPRARMVPLPIAALGAVLALAQLIYQNVRPADDLQIDVLEFLTSRGDRPDTPDRTEDGEQGEAPPRRVEEDAWGREAVAAGFVVLLTAAALLLGPLPAIFLFFAGYVVVRRQYSWPKALALSAAFTAVVYFLFGAVLGVQIDQSVFGPLLGL